MLISLLIFILIAALIVYILSILPLPAPIQPALTYVVGALLVIYVLLHFVAPLLRGM